MVSIQESLTFVLLLLALALLVVVGGHGTTVYPTSSNCSQVSDGAQVNNTSLQMALAMANLSTLVLEPGCHYLTELHIVANLTNVSLLGSGSHNTYITCSSRAGLAFVNVSSLVLENFTVIMCGITGDALDRTVAKLRMDESHEHTFAFPTTTEIAVIVGLSVDMSLSNVHIRDTNGIGLLLSDVLGEVLLDSITIASNYHRGCYIVNSTFGYGIGGGAIFLFTRQNLPLPPVDTLVMLTNSLFEYNSYCGYSTINQLNAQLTSNLFSYQGQYDIGGGGGLTAYFIQTNYTVSFDVANCTFKNNTAPYGGGIYFGTFVGAYQFNVDVMDSTFLQNGIANYVYTNYNDSERFKSDGQGITFIQDISFPSVHRPVLPVTYGANSYKIRNCKFLGNKARLGGAVSFFSRYISISSNTTTLEIDTCHFENNSALYASAVQLLEEKYTATQLGTQFVLNDCTFHNNVLVGNSDTIISTLEGSGIIEMVSVNATLSGNNTFSNNTGSGIRMTTSILNIVNETTFINNSGVYGGGIAVVSNSYIVLHAGSTLRFTSNEAFVAGGAMFVQLLSPSPISYFDCFLFIEQLDLRCADYGKCFDPTELGISVYFNGNEATSGSVIFGSTLTTCPWLNALKISKNVSLDSLSYEFLEKIDVFRFDNDTIKTNFKQSFTTNIGRIEINTEQTVPIMPGQYTTVNITAYDYFNQVSSATLSSYIDDSQVNGPYRSMFGDSGFTFIDGRLHDVSISLQSRTQVTQASNITIGVHGVGDSVSNTFDLLLQDCYPGFKFDSEAASQYKRCLCDPQLDQFQDNIECDADSAVIRVSNGYWVGIVDKDTGRLASHQCVLNYCQTGDVNVTNGQFFQQCSDGYNRKGILCGECEDGHSVQLGSNACKRCHNYYLFLILFFVAAGFLVIFVIGRLGMTVSVGYINCILFYCNIVAPFLPYIVPQETGHPYSIVISMINLNMGIPVCFFNGMTALHSAFLNFVFPAYLWLLLGFYTILLRKNKARWLCKQYPAPVFATVILVSYTSTLQACINALSFLILANARNPVRWTIDPSVPYGREGWHIALILISLVHIIGYIIPMPILLLFPAFTLRTSFGKKWIPIYDAFWAPFREKFHFWVGLRLLVRVVPLILSSFAPAPHNLLGLGIFVVVYLIAHIYFKPFKNEILNVFDVYLMLNILLLVMGSLYFSGKLNLASEDHDIDRVLQHLIIYFNIMISLFYAILLVLLCYRIYQQKFRLVQKVKMYFMQKRATKKGKQELLMNDSDGTTEPINLDITPKVTYSQLRESLLEIDSTILERTKH